MLAGNLYYRLRRVFRARLIDWAKMIHGVNCAAVSEGMICFIKVVPVSYVLGHAGSVVVQSWFLRPLGKSQVYLKPGIGCSFC